MRLRVQMSADLEPARAKFRLGSADMHRVALAGLRGMTKYVPMDTGELMGSGHVEGEEAVWSTDYAVYAYFPRGHIHTTKNPTAHREWVRYYESQGAPEVVREVVRIVNSK